MTIGEVEQSHTQTQHPPHTTHTPLYLYGERGESIDTSTDAPDVLAYYMDWIFVNGD